MSCATEEYVERIVERAPGELLEKDIAADDLALRQPRVSLSNSPFTPSIFCRQHLHLNSGARGHNSLLPHPGWICHTQRAIAKNPPKEGETGYSFFFFKWVGRLATTASSGAFPPLLTWGKEEGKEEEGEEFAASPRRRLRCCN